MGQNQAKAKGLGGRLPEHDHSGDRPCPACMPEHMMIYENNPEQDELNRKLFDLLQESNAVDLSNWLDEYVVIGEDIPDLSNIDPNTPLGVLAARLREKLESDDRDLTTLLRPKDTGEIPSHFLLDKEDARYLEPIKEESNAGSVSDLGSTGAASKLTLQALLAQDSGGRPRSLSPDEERNMRRAQMLIAGLGNGQWSPVYSLSSPSDDEKDIRFGMHGSTGSMVLDENGPEGFSDDSSADGRHGYPHPCSTGSSSSLTSLTELAAVAEEEEDEVDSSPLKRQLSLLLRSKLDTSKYPERQYTGVAATDRRTDLPSDGCAQGGSEPQPSTSYAAPPATAQQPATLLGLVRDRSEEDEQIKVQTLINTLHNRELPRYDETYVENGDLRGPVLAQSNHNIPHKPTIGRSDSDSTVMDLLKWSAAPELAAYAESEERTGRSHGHEDIQNTTGSPQNGDDLDFIVGESAQSDKGHLDSSEAADSETMTRVEGGRRLTDFNSPMADMMGLGTGAVNGAVVPGSHDHSDTEPTGNTGQIGLGGNLVGAGVMEHSDLDTEERNGEKSTKVNALLEHLMRKMSQNDSEEGDLVHGSSLDQLDEEVFESEENVGGASNLNDNDRGKFKRTLMAQRQHSTVVQPPEEFEGAGASGEVSGLVTNPHVGHKGPRSSDASDRSYEVINTESTLSNNAESLKNSSGGNALPTDLDNSPDKGNASASGEQAGHGGDGAKEPERRKSSFAAGIASLINWQKRKSSSDKEHPKADDSSQGTQSEKGVSLVDVRDASDKGTPDEQSAVGPGVEEPIVPVHVLPLGPIDDEPYTPGNKDPIEDVIIPEHASLLGHEDVTDAGPDGTGISAAVAGGKDVKESSMDVAADVKSDKVDDKSSKNRQDGTDNFEGSDEENQEEKGKVAKVIDTIVDKLAFWRIKKKKKRRKPKADEFADSDEEEEEAGEEEEEGEEDDVEEEVINIDVDTRSDVQKFEDEDGVKMFTFGPGGKHLSYKPDDDSTEVTFKVGPNGELMPHTVGADNNEILYKAGSKGKLLPYMFDPEGNLVPTKLGPDGQTVHFNMHPSGEKLPYKINSKGNLSPSRLEKYQRLLPRESDADKYDITYKIGPDNVLRPYILSPEGQLIPFSVDPEQTDLSYEVAKADTLIPLVKGTEGDLVPCTVGPEGKEVTLNLTEENETIFRVNSQGHMEVSPDSEGDLTLLTDKVVETDGDKVVFKIGADKQLLPFVVNDNGLFRPCCMTDYGTFAPFIPPKDSTDMYYKVDPEDNLHGYILGPRNELVPCKVAEVDDTVTFTVAPHQKHVSYLVREDHLESTMMKGDGLDRHMLPQSHTLNGDEIIYTVLEDNILLPTVLGSDGEWIPCKQRPDGQLVPDIVEADGPDVVYKVEGDDHMVPYIADEYGHLKTCRVSQTDQEFTFIAIPSHKEASFKVVPDGTLMPLGETNGELIQYDAGPAGQEVVYKVSSDGTLVPYMLDSDSNLLPCSVNYDGQLVPKFFDPDSAEVTYKITHNNQMVPFIDGPQGQLMLCTVGHEGQEVTFRVDTNGQEHPFQVAPDSFVVPSDGKLPNSLLPFDCGPAGHQVAYKVTTDSSLMPVLISPDGFIEPCSIDSDGNISLKPLAPNSLEVTYRVGTRSQLVPFMDGPKSQLIPCQVGHEGQHIDIKSYPKAENVTYVVSAENQLLPHQFCDYAHIMHCETGPNDMEIAYKIDRENCLQPFLVSPSGFLCPCKKEPNGSLRVLDIEADTRELLYKVGHGGQLLPHVFGPRNQLIPCRITDEFAQVAFKIGPKLEKVVFNIGSDGQCVPCDADAASQLLSEAKDAGYKIVYKVDDNSVLIPYIESDDGTLSPCMVASDGTIILQELDHDNEYVTYRIGEHGELYPFMDGLRGELIPCKVGTIGEEVSFALGPQGHMSPFVIGDDGILIPCNSVSSTELVNYVSGVDYHDLVLKVSPSGELIPFTIDSDGLYTPCRVNSDGNFIPNILEPYSKDIIYKVTLDGQLIPHVNGPKGQHMQCGVGFDGQVVCFRAGPYDDPVDFVNETGCLLNPTMKQNAVQLLPNIMKPEDQEIVYKVNSKGKLVPYMMDADIMVPCNVSPDGRLMPYKVELDSSEVTYRVNAEGQLLPHVDGPSGELIPCIVGNRDQEVIFSVHGAGKAVPFVVSFDGYLSPKDGKADDILSRPGNVPDGFEICYKVCRDKALEPFLIDANGTVHLCRLDSDGNFEPYKLEPDGDEVCYTIGHNGELVANMLSPKGQLMVATISNSQPTVTLKAGPKNKDVEFNITVGNTLEPKNQKICNRLLPPTTLDGDKIVYKVGQNMQLVAYILDPEGSLVPCSVNGKGHHKKNDITVDGVDVIYEVGEGGCLLPGFLGPQGQVIPCRLPEEGKEVQLQVGYQKQPVDYVVGKDGELQLSEGQYNPRLAAKGPQGQKIVFKVKVSGDLVPYFYDPSGKLLPCSFGPNGIEEEKPELSAEMKGKYKSKVFSLGWLSRRTLPLSFAYRTANRRWTEPSIQHMPSDYCLEVLAAQQESPELEYDVIDVDDLPVFQSSHEVSNEGTASHGQVNVVNKKFAPNSSDKNEAIGKEQFRSKPVLATVSSEDSGIVSADQESPVFQSVDDSRELSFVSESFKEKADLQPMFEFDPDSMLDDPESPFKKTPDFASSKERFKPVDDLSDTASYHSEPIWDGVDDDRCLENDNYQDAMRFRSNSDVTPVIPLDDQIAQLEREILGEGVDMDFTKQSSRGKAGRKRVLRQHSEGDESPGARRRRRGHVRGYSYDTRVGGPHLGGPGFANAPLFSRSGSHIPKPALSSTRPASQIPKVTSHIPKRSSNIPIHGRKLPEAAKYESEDNDIEEATADWVLDNEDGGQPGFSSTVPLQQSRGRISWDSIPGDGHTAAPWELDTYDTDQEVVDNGHDKPKPSFGKMGWAKLKAAHVATKPSKMNAFERLAHAITVSFSMKRVKQDQPDSVPDADSYEPDSEAAVLARRMHRLLEESRSGGVFHNQLNLDGVSAKVTLQAMGLAIGDQVIVGGVKSGLLKYAGPTQFAPGIWAGIELDEPVGKNDGTVAGVSYFKCSPKHGIFAPINKISRPGGSDRGGHHFQRGPINHGRIDTSHVTAKVDTAKASQLLSSLKAKRIKGLSRRAARLPMEGDMLDQGDRVLVAGQRRGVVRYSGETDFAPGWWYGIELDRPVGKNDGSVNGQRYFNCKAKFGVFAPPSRVQKLEDDMSSISSLDPPALGSAVSQPSLSLSGTSPAKTGLNRREPAGGASKQWGKVRAGTLLARTGSMKQPRSSGSTTSLRRTQSSTGADLKLVEGMSVFCNNELGTLRYIGPVDFAEGIWLGVELRSPRGKNDGSVQGRRYFTCKPAYGLLVRPSKVTVRGINGAKLLGESNGTSTEKL